MKRYEAIMATTHLLPNGFRHTREDLEALAEGFKKRINVDPFLNQDHLEGIAPIGRVLETHVDNYMRDGLRSETEYALYLTFEVLPGTDPETVRRFIEEGGFSVAFFGLGLGKGPKDATEFLTVGVSSELLPELPSARPMLDELSKAWPEAEVEVRRYHEHAFLATTTVVLVIGWVGGKIADKLFDKLWTVIESTGLKAWRALVKRVKLSFNTRNGTVYVVMPAQGERETYRRTLNAIVDEVVTLENGVERRRLSIMALRIGLSRSMRNRFRSALRNRIRRLRCARCL